jgi:hypothetical protein
MPLTITYQDPNLNMRPDVTVVTLSGGIATSGDTWTIDRRLYKTDDGRIVEEGAPGAAFLFATPGMVMPVAEARAAGLIETPPEETPAAKQREAAKNKQRQRAADKTRTRHRTEREALRTKQAAEVMAADKIEPNQQGEKNDG